MNITVHCPHCGLLAHVRSGEADKGVLYHGIIKKNGHRLANNLPADWYQYIRDNDIVYGCAKPFILVRKSSIQYEAVPYNPEVPKSTRRRATVIPCGRVEWLSKR